MVNARRPGSTLSRSTGLLQPPYFLMFLCSYNYQLKHSKAYPITYPRGGGWWEEHVEPKSHARAITLVTRSLCLILLGVRQHLPELSVCRQQSTTSTFLYIMITLQDLKLQMGCSILLLILFRIIQYCNVKCICLSIFPSIN